MSVPLANKVLVAGQSILSTTDGAVVRFNTDGSLDATFGTSGVFVRPNGGGFGWVRSVAQDASGGVLCTLRSTSGTVNTGLIRLTSAGVLDTAFGSRPSWRTTIVDYGKNLSNVRASRAAMRG